MSNSRSQLNAAASKLPRLCFRFDMSGQGAMRRNNRELDVYMWDWDVNRAYDVDGQYQLVKLGQHLKTISRKTNEISDRDRLGAYVMLLAKNVKNETVRRVGLGEAAALRSGWNSSSGRSLSHWTDLRSSLRNKA